MHAGEFAEVLSTSTAQQYITLESNLPFSIRTTAEKDLLATVGIHTPSRREQATAQDLPGHSLQTDHSHVGAARLTQLWGPAPQALALGQVAWGGKCGRQARRGRQQQRRRRPGQQAQGARRFAALPTLSPAVFVCSSCCPQQLHRGCRAGLRPLTNRVLSSPVGAGFAGGRRRELGGRVRTRQGQLGDHRPRCRRRRPRRRRLAARPGARGRHACRAA